MFFYFTFQSSLFHFDNIRLLVIIIVCCWKSFFQFIFSFSWYTFFHATPHGLLFMHFLFKQSAIFFFNLLNNRFLIFLIFTVFCFFFHFSLSWFFLFTWISFDLFSVLFFTLVLVLFGLSRIFFQQSFTLNPCFYITSTFIQFIISSKSYLAMLSLLYPFSIQKIILFNFLFYSDFGFSALFGPD